MSTEEARASQSTAAPQLSTATGAVFLSYASEDVAAVGRIATALRAAGIEVCFDKSELRGGDAWDRQIRDQIHDRRLFLPVISAQTEAREEGYFRREWRPAVERAGDMADKRAFLVPVVIDGTSERRSSVPEKFRELQWTRLPEGETSAAFVERMRRLFVGGSSHHPAATAVPVAFTTVSRVTRSVPASGRSKTAAWAIAALLVVALGTYMIAHAYAWCGQRDQALVWLSEIVACCGSRSTAIFAACEGTPATAPCCTG